MEKRDRNDRINGGEGGGGEGEQTESTERARGTLRFIFSSGTLIVSFLSHRRVLALV